MEIRRKNLQHKFIEAKQRAEFILYQKDKMADKVPKNMKKKQTKTLEG
jgi:hypothetical protein